VPRLFWLLEKREFGHENNRISQKWTQILEKDTLDCRSKRFFENSKMSISGVEGEPLTSESSSFAQNANLLSSFPSLIENIFDIVNN
jgi:hypothetical protein